MRKKILPLILIGVSLVSIFFDNMDKNVYAKDYSDEIIVGVFTDRHPMFYIDETSGEIIGIGVDLMNTAADNADLNIVFKEVKEPNLKQALDNTEYDLILPLGSDITSSSGKETIVSNEFIQTPFTFVTLKSSSLNNINSIKVGMLSSLKGVSETLTTMYPNITIVFYDDMKDSVKALHSGEVDALLNNAYVWSYILQKPAYSDLYMYPSIILSVDFRAGAIDTEDNRIIIDKLNSGIDSISDTTKQSIILDYTSRKLYKYNLEDYANTYGIFAIFTLFLFASILMHNSYKQKLLKLKNEEYVNEILNKDALTGALSMRGFRSKVESLLKEHPNNKYMLVYTNFRDFKYINSKFGKTESDNLLKFLVSRFMDILSDEEAIGRLESDHFVIFRNLCDDTIKYDSEHAVNPVRSYFIDRGKEVIVQVCSGIYVLMPEDYTNTSVDYMIDLARVAEKKVRETKKDGYDFYNHSQWKKGMWLSDVVGHLQSAIDNNEIQVYYQPQVNYETGKITGAEALCRWKHSKLGWISPGDFIPALEDAGLIDKLDYYVWDRVCQDLERWNSQGVYKSVSINISRFDIKDDLNIVEYIYGLVKKYDLYIHQLNVEITETAYVENTSLINITKQFRDLGFHVEIDDFGSGYSSLNMLKEIPVDRIKMDLRFLSGNDTEEKGNIIIECMIFMAKRLGISLIAEGVETVEQANMLKELGCVDMQGYYFYKALSVEEFEKIEQ